MSKEVDSRVVQMQFDNRNFEKNAQESMNTLDKLKAKLNFKGSAKSVSELEDSVNHINLSTLSRSVETITGRFSNMGIIGVTALQNITNKAITTGEHLLRTFTIEPVSTGFSEYELKMGSVQTIMASTGESLDTVNQYLAELNTYSDKTIYSFSDMTQNIGKFTNAGVKLKDAVKAIKGVSNEAAISGANANEASRAMYNFAQALSAGSVKLIDWKSIENANMATVEFKNQLIDTALELGTLRKEGGKYISTTTNIQGKVSEAFNATSMFNESLNHQWMTTDVLVKTLGDYADETTDIGKKAYASAQDVKTFSMMMDTLKEAAQSGWSETWEIIVGDFEESKKLWTNLSNFFGDIIAKSAKFRNDFLGTIFDSPWEKLTDKIAEAGIKVDDFSNDLMSLAKDRGVDIDAFIEKGMTISDMVSQGIITGNMIKDIINKIAGTMGLANDATEEVTQKVVDLENVVNNVIHGDFGNGADRVKALTEAGYDYAVVQDMVNKTLWGEAVEYEHLTDEQLKAVGYTDKQIEQFRSLAEKAGAAGSSIDELIANMQKPTAGQLILDTFKNIFKGVSGVVKAVKEAWRGVFKINPESLYKVIESINEMSKAFVISEERIESITTMFSSLFSVVRTTATKAINFVKEGFKFFLDNIPNISFSLHILIESVTDTANAFNDWLNSSNKIVDVWGLLQNGIDKLKEWFSSAKLFAKDIASAMSTIWSSITTGMESMFTKAKSTVKNNCKAAIDATGATESKINASFSAMNDRVGEFADETGGKLKNMFTNICNFIKGIDVNKVLNVIGTISASAIAVSIAKITKSFRGVADTFAGVLKGLTGVLKEFQSQIKAKAIKEISVSLIMLSGALLVMSFIPADKLYKATTVMTTLFAGLVTAMKNLTILEKSSAKGAAATAMTMVAISTSVLILAGALAVASTLDVNQVGSSLISIVGLTMTLVTALQYLSKNQVKMVKGSMSMILMAKAISILAGACKVMEGVSIGSVFKVMTVMATLAVFMRSMNDVLFVSNNTLSSSKSASSGKILAMSASITLIAAGLLSMSIAIHALGSIDGIKLIKGLATITGILAIVGVFMNVLKGTEKSSISLLAISSALLVFIPVIAILGNLHWSVIAIGLGTIAAAFTILGVAGLLLEPLTPTIKALSLSLLSIGASAALFGTGMALIAKALVVGSAGLVAFTTALITSLGIIAGEGALITKVLITIMSSVIDSVNECLHKVLNLIITNVPMIANAIITFLTNIVRTVLESISGILNLIIEYSPQIIGKVIDIILILLTSLKDHTKEFTEIAVGIIVAFIDGIASQMDEIVRSAVELVIAFITGVVDTLTANAPVVAQALSDLLAAAFDVLWETLKSAVNTVFGLAGRIWKEGFIDGICGKFAEAYESVTGFIDEVKKKFTDWADGRSMWEVAEDLILGFVQGIWDCITYPFKAVSSFCSRVMSKFEEGFDTHSPSKKTMWLGKMIDEGLAKGIDNNQQNVMRNAQNMTDNLMSIMSEDLSNDFNMIGPRLMPSINMSGIKNSIRSLNTMMNGTDISSMGVSMHEDKNLTVTHEFGTLRVEGVNDNGQFIAAADYSVEQMLTRLLRKQGRR